MMAPFITASRQGASYSADVVLRTDEPTRWKLDAVIAPGESLRGITIGERVHVGAGAAIRDAYALESLDVDANVVARTLTSDGDLRIGSEVTVLRWADSDGTIDAGNDTDLGLSASSTGETYLRDRVRFERVWGSPVVSKSSVVEPFPAPSHPKTTTIDAPREPANEPLILFGPVAIGAGTRLSCDLKIHGPLVVHPGVRIDGTLIVRGDVTFVSDVTVLGHVFSEGIVRVGPRSSIGRPGGVKTLYAARRIELAGDVRVHGWIVAEDGGTTR
jgi:predicted acyltransferase (DUF342 family)